MNLTARETKENRNDFLKEIRLNEKIATYMKCRLKNLNKSIYVSSLTRYRSLHQGF